MHGIWTALGSFVSILGEICRNRCEQCAKTWAESGRPHFACSILVVCRLYPKVEVMVWLAPAVTPVQNGGHRPNIDSAIHEPSFSKRAPKPRQNDFERFRSSLHLLARPHNGPRHRARLHPSEFGMWLSYAGKGFRSGFTKVVFAASENSRSRR
jgi:hypothetical protein